MTRWFQVAALMCVSSTGCLLLANPPMLRDKAPIKGWSKVVVEGDRLCALHESGELWCGAPSKLRVVEGERFIDITHQGSSGACTVSDDGKLACGREIDSYTYPDTFDIVGTFVAVTGGPGAGCGLATDGTVACWPDNNPPSSTFLTLGAGDSFACGVELPALGLRCWRIDGYSYSSEDDIVIPPSGRFAFVDTLDSVACALTTQGSIQCWGSSSSDSALQPPGGSGFVHLAISDQAACAVNSEGQVQCWGEDANDPTRAELRAPEGVAFTSLDLSNKLSCGIDNNTVLHCWGDG